MLGTSVIIIMIITTPQTNSDGDVIVNENVRHDNNNVVKNETPNNSSRKYKDNLKTTKGRNNENNHC